MERDIEEDFQILADYLAEKKTLSGDSDSENDEEEKCEHREGVETEEDFVCCKCGLVLSNIF